jgi:hypothetical protein
MLMPFIFSWRTSPGEEGELQKRLLDTLRSRNSKLPSSLGRLNTMMLKTGRLKTSLPPPSGVGDWLLWSSSYGAEHLHFAGFF